MLMRDVLRELKGYVYNVLGRMVFWRMDDFPSDETTRAFVLSAVLQLCGDGDSYFFVNIRHYNMLFAGEGSSTPCVSGSIHFAIEPKKVPCDRQSLTVWFDDDAMHKALPPDLQFPDGVSHAEFSDPIKALLYCMRVMHRLNVVFTAAYKIQRAFKRAIADPQYAMCRRRLMRELSETLQRK